jgi:hypothetical protein
VADNRSTKLLDLVNTNDVRNLIFNRLDLQSIGRVASLNKSFATMCASQRGGKSIDMIAAERLIMLLRNADWEAAEIILKKKPDLMFQRVLVGRNENNHDIRISPLQYSILVVDNHGLVMFQDHIKNVKQVALYKEQNAEQTNRNDIQAFSDVYNEHMSQMRDPAFDTDAADKFFREQVGLAQRNLLPRWLLKEMLYVEDSNWINPGRYYAGRPQGDFHIYDENNRKTKIDLDAKNAGLGYDYALFLDHVVVDYDTFNDPVYRERVFSNSTCNTQYRKRQILTTNAQSNYERFFHHRQGEQVKKLAEIITIENRINDEIANLQTYIARRGDANAPENLTFFGRFFGCSKTQKIEAATARLNYLYGNANESELAQHSKALKQGELGRVCKR